MSVFISMLRGVNVGSHNRIKMDALRSLYESLKLEDPRTYVQSGNIVFRTKEKNEAQLAKKIQAGIGKKFGFQPEVILRTAAEVRAVIAGNPFAERKDIHPGKLLVSFLTEEPPGEVETVLESFKDFPEELHLKGRELYIYFPNGAGTSKVPWSKLEKLFKVNGTARNWNTVLSLLAIAEEMEGQ